MRSRGGTTGRSQSAAYNDDRIDEASCARVYWKRNEERSRCTHDALEGIVIAIDRRGFACPNSVRGVVWSGRGDRKQRANGISLDE